MDKYEKETLTKEEDKNSFDSFFSVVEQMRIYVEETSLAEDIEIALTRVDRTIQNIKETSERYEYTDAVFYNKSRLIVSQTIEKLKACFGGLHFDKNTKGWNPEMSKRIVKYISDVEETIGMINQDDTEEEIVELFSLIDEISVDELPITEKESPNLFGGLMRKLKDSIKSSSGTRSDDKKVPSKEDKVIDNYRVWDIEIIFEGEDLDAAQISYLLWTFSEAMTSLDGVEVKIRGWNEGSLIVRLKALLKDELAEEELKDILIKARQFGMAKLEEPAIKGEKITSETEKIEAETEKIKKEVEGLPDEEAVEKRRQLENKRIEAEIEGVNLDNSLKKIVALEKISELIKSGFVSNDSNFQISINELLYLKKTDGKYLEGEDMDSIGDNAA